MRNLRTPFRLFPDCWHSNTTALVLWVAGHNAGRHHNHPSCSLCCGADRPRVGTFLPRSELRGSFAPALSALDGVSSESITSISWSWCLGHHVRGSSITSISWSWPWAIKRVPWWPGIRQEHHPCWAIKTQSESITSISWFEHQLVLTRIESITISWSWCLVHRMRGSSITSISWSWCLGHHLRGSLEHHEHQLVLAWGHQEWVPWWPGIRQEHHPCRAIKTESKQIHDESITSIS
eukprot:s1120_g9.t1